MSDNEFTFIGSSKGVGVFVNVNPSNARLSNAAHEAIGSPRWVTIEGNAKLMVKLTPCEEGHRHASALDLSNQIGKLSRFVRDQKCRFGRYPAEVRDGSLYFQLEPAE